MNFLAHSCSGCGNCLLICPVQAIRQQTEQVEVDWESCVECHNCVRSGVCPNGSFEFSSPPWPRTLRATFSDPFFRHESTQHLGRGTEEVKTNDVTNLVKPGEVGLAVEAGRPGIGASFGDAEIITKILAKYPVQYPDKTPIRALIANAETGELRPDILAERVLSVIVECRLPSAHLYPVLAALRTAMEQVKTTVFSVGVFTRKGELDFRLKPAVGYELSPGGKNNMGLGRSCREGQ